LILWPASDNPQLMQPVIINRFPTPSVHNHSILESPLLIISEKIEIRKRTLTHCDFIADICSATSSKRCRFSEASKLW